MIAGHTFSSDTDISKNNGESDMWIVKIDAIGNLVWEKTYGGMLFDAAQAISASKDGGFIIVGNSKSNDMDVVSNAGQNDIWVVKTDKNGDIIWQKTFGGSGLDFGFDVLETATGEVVLVGEAASDDFSGIVNKGNTDAVMIKVR